MTESRSIPFRGHLRSILADGNTVVFAVEHPDGISTSLYRLNCQDLQLTETAMPGGALSVAGTAAECWVLGGDERLYSVDDKKAADWGIDFEDAPRSVSVVDDKRLAVIAGNRLVIVNRKKKKAILQTIELPAAGTAVAVDPTGQWLAVGTNSGQVAVYQAEEQAEFQLSKQDKLHEGSVTCLLFEPEELRFLSAGLDHKLLLTHARGKLEPEDRGRGGGHTDQVTSLLHVSGERFVSGSLDGSLKTWARSGGARPATLSDGVPSVVDLAVVEIHERPHLVAAGSDNTLRLWLLDASGRFGQATHVLRDAWAGAEEELGQTDVSRREAALRQLAAFDDTASLDLIAGQIDDDADHGQRVLATELLGASDHPRAVALLEPRLKHRDEAVRAAAFNGLCRQHADDPLRPTELALKAKHRNTGVLAVETLKKLAAKNDLAFQRLVGALSNDPYEVRFAALSALESLGGKDDPDASLRALSTDHADLRASALIRLLQRKLTGDILVQAALRRHLEDVDAGVRRTAFLISVLASADLSRALRARDKDLHRQMFELETRVLDEKQTKKQKAELPKTRRTKISLKDEHFDPLLQAMAACSVDVCVLGTRCLALLEDPRAFGVLLQLSRNQDKEVRVDVCRALEVLKDTRGENRLRELTHDRELQVRDAAFSALTATFDDVLDAAEAGLVVPFEDVQRRALQLLGKQLKEKLTKSAGDRGRQLMELALNSGFEAVRIEAFKSSLNLNLGGDIGATLRMMLQSRHADVRREVLTEVMSQPREEWAWQLLLEFMTDPESSLRTEALEFAIKFTKGRDLQPVQAALKSPFVDTRRQAIQQLQKRPSQAGQQLLLEMIDDEDTSVRRLALDGLLAVADEQVVTTALECRHQDIRVAAARSWARSGDPAVIPVLMEIIAAPEPDLPDAKAAWKDLVVTALNGLAELGNPEAFESLVPLLGSSHGGIRTAAAEAMTWTASAESTDALKEALRHEDTSVSRAAALGLAMLGDVTGVSKLPDIAAGGALDGLTALAIGHCLGTAGDNLTLQMLDSSDDLCRTATLIVMLARDLLAHQGTPEKALTCLSAQDPRVRLWAADAIQSFGDEQAMLQQITGLLNDRKTEASWQIPVEDVRQLCVLIEFAPSHTQARSIQLLQHLRLGERDVKQDVWDVAWQTHVKRFAQELATAETTASKQKRSKSTMAVEEIRQLAFGTLVGILRDPVGNQQERDGAERSLRLTAMNRLRQLIELQPSCQAMVQPVLIQALGYPGREVRMAAFDHLKALQMDAAALSTAAIESGWEDLGVAGLGLLTEDASAAQAKKILEQCMLTRTDELALRSALLLIERTKVVPVAKKAGDAVSHKVRLEAVRWLTDAYDDDPAARKQLQTLLTSRHADVRWAAAQKLAIKNDESALDALIERLQDADKRQQLRTIDVLTNLSHARVPEALLARVTDDVAATAQVAALLSAAGRYRRPENAAALLQMMERQEWRKPAGAAVLCISGFDQRIEDPDEDQPNDDWLKEQHPRHPEILAELMQRWLELGDAGALKQLIPGARWAQDGAVDPVLSLLTVHSDDDLRQAAVEALSWRLRERDGSADALLKALEHKEPVTRLIAAEGLARAGRNDGITVLLAAVDLMSDLSLRQRAVNALGALADERALDVLLKLAAEDEHALQEEAIEAIGHMSASDQSEEIFRLLKKFAVGVAAPTELDGLQFQQDGLRERAIRGLRWFNSRDGWALIRDRAAVDLNPENYYTPEWQTAAVEMLGYDNDDATQSLLLKIIECGSLELVEEAFQSARRVFGSDSLEPDFALLKTASDVERDESLRRVQDADAGRLFEILTVCAPSVFISLSNALLNRDDLPGTEALDALPRNEPMSVGVAAQVLGRTGKLTKSGGGLVATALETWLEEWDRLRNLQVSNDWQDEWSEDGNLQYMTRQELAEDFRFEQVTVCLRRLFWAAGRLGVARPQLLDAIRNRVSDQWFWPLRVTALQGLADSKPDKQTSQLLQELLSDQDAEVRQLATSMLATHNRSLAEESASELLSDRQAFDRLMKSGKKAPAVLSESAGDAHSQGVVLPHLVAANSHQALLKVAEDGELPEQSRLGAIEGLARMASDEAEKALSRLGKSKKLAEELQRAAWAGLRRSRRRRRKQAALSERSV